MKVNIGKDKFLNILAENPKEKHQLEKFYEDNVDSILKYPINIKLIFNT